MLPENFDFLYPALFTGLLLLLPVYFLYKKQLFKTEKFLERVGFFLEQPVKSYKRGKIRRFLLWLSVFVFILISLARPVGDKVELPRIKASNDIVVLLDVSRSMLANDVLPNRLDKAKDFIDKMIGGLKGEKVALLIFSGTTTIISPLTSDYFYLRKSLERVTPNSVRQGGTDIRKALEFAIEVMFKNYDETEPGAKKGTKDIIMLSDGENIGSDVIESAVGASRKGIVINTISLGLPDGGKIKLDSGDYLKYEGSEVLSKPDEDTMRLIAGQTGGVFIPLRDYVIDPVDIFESYIRRNSNSEVRDENSWSFSELYGYFLFAGLFILLLIIPLMSYRSQQFMKQ